jgi:glycosyltransferase involved in cell wall biosynthesis
MRVGFFTDTFRPNLNGVVVSIESFAAELIDLGCESVVFAPRPPRRPPAARTAPAITVPYDLPGIDTIHWVPSMRSLIGPGHRIGLPFLRRLLSLAQREELDVIHTQTPFQIGYAGISIARKLGVPIVHTYHTYFAEYVHYLKVAARLGKLAAPRYSRWFCNLHDLVLAPSTDIQRVLRGYGVRRPVEVLETGVPLPARLDAAEQVTARATLGLPAECRVLLYVGRLAREKNLDLLLAAARRLAAWRDDFVLLLVGDGPGRQQLERDAARLGIGRHVRFSGWVDHDRLRPYFAAATLFVFPSVTETQGLSLLEAMAHGVPVVASVGPAIGDLVEPGRNGLLVAPESGDLSEAIDALLDDPALAGLLARGARNAAARLDAQRQATRLFELFESLVGHSRRTARRGLRGLAARAWEEATAWR